MVLEQRRPEVRRWDLSGTGDLSGDCAPPWRSCPSWSSCLSGLHLGLPRVTLMLCPPVRPQGPLAGDAMPLVPGCDGAPGPPPFTLYHCPVSRKPSLNTTNLASSSPCIPSSHQYLLSSYDMPGPVLGTTAVNKATIFLALSPLPTGGHRSPRTTWNLSCDQSVQDEVPRAQKTVPGFGLVRTVKEGFLEEI